jgi:hypothetical protein
MLNQSQLEVGFERWTLKALGKTFHPVKNDLLMTGTAHGHH